MRAWVVALMLFVAAAKAQPRRPTIRFVCKEGACLPAEPVPGRATIDLVIEGAVSQPPVVISAGKAVIPVPCAKDASTWCATEVGTAELVIRGSAPEHASGGASLVGDPRTDTLPIRVAVTGDRVTIDLIERPALVGPDVVDADEHFEDVVLVGDRTRFRCSGIFITPRHVLSAAHCLPATSIGIGNSMADAVPVAVTSTIRHPTADVAVLEIAVPASLTPRPRRRDPSTSAPLGIARILGFGVSDQLNLTGFGRKRSLSVPVDGWGCNVQRSRELGCALGRELLLRGGRGNDTCLGDSGGPLFEETPGGLRLVGITSRGTRPKKLLCGEGGIYTRVDVLATWIDEVIKP